MCFYEKGKKSIKEVNWNSGVLSAIGIGTIYDKGIELTSIFCVYFENVEERLKYRTVAMWQTPVLCVTLNGQFFRCWDHILRYAAVKATGGFDLSRGGGGGFARLWEVY